MIEFRQGNDSNSYYLFHDGKNIENVLIERKKSSYYNVAQLVNVITVLDRKAGEIIISLIDKERDFPAYERLEIHHWNSEGEIKFLRLIIRPITNYFTFDILVKELDNRNSEVEFIGFFIGLKGKDFVITPNNFSFYGDHIRFEVVVNKKGQSFLECVLESEKKIREFYRVAVNKFLTEIEVSIFTAFNFPEKLKNSCEQYLLYFAQFLRDLVGINVTSELKEEAGKVLFSVTPTDDIEALDKIREALAVYLNLPSSPVLYNDSFQSMQLKQQVENLQHSQRMKEMEMRSAQYALRLAQQNIENQDKIIIQQNSFIDNQNKIIEKITSKSIMIDSLENKEELEKFCEGFEVGKSEFLIKHFGLHLNPATVLKNAGRKILGKEERKSILCLDEETDDKGN